MSEPTPPAGDPPRRPEPAEARGAGFRWQALFQRSTDAFFLLDRQRRLRFVNRAWEALTGLAAADVRLLSCKRKRQAAAGEALPDVLSRVLCPPAEVMQGEAGRARRRLPAADGRGWRWWDVEFLPLRVGGHPGGVLGRVLPVADETPADAVPLPEKLVDLRERVVRRYEFPPAESAVPAVRRLAEQARLAASVSAPVFLAGETGTGKETLARAIHYRGAHRERPLAALDCARLPPEAVAALLFADRGPAPGRPAAVYLREPGRLPRELQARLCDQLASGGAPRLFAGSRTPPAEDVRSGRLLGELFAAFPLVLELPPLRERPDDLSALLGHLLERANGDGGPRAPGLTPAARELVQSHPWPGNVRELFEAIGAARRHAAGRAIDVADLPASLRLRHAAGAAPPPERPLPLDALLEQAERRLIELALRRAKGNRGRAAEILGIWRARLLRRVEALGLDGGNPDGGSS